MDFLNIDDIAVKERLKTKIYANKFSSFIGIEYTNVEIGKVNCKLELKPHHQQQNGYAHGGLLATLCDIVAGFAAYTTIPTNKQVVTGEIKVSYYRAGKGKTLFAEGNVVKKGRRVTFTESTVFYLSKNNERKEVVKATASMIVIGEDF